MKVKSVTIETVPDRTVLQFVALTQKHFGFLEKQGFRCVHSEPTCVRFEGSTFFITIYHELRSYEIGPEFGRLGHRNAKQQSYSTADFLGIAGVPTAGEYRDYAAITRDGVEEGLTKLARLFCDYVTPNLRHADLFQKLDEQERIRVHDFVLEMNLAQARQKLAAAWRAKNYAQVISALRPLRDALTPRERRKLEYAEKHAT